MLYFATWHTSYTSDISYMRESSSEAEKYLQKVYNLSILQKG